MKRSFGEGFTAAEAWNHANEQMDWPRLTVELSRSLPRVPSPSGKASVLSYLLRDIRYAFRQLLRSPGFAVTAITILAIAIGASIAIFFVLDALVLHPLPFREPEQLVKITESIKKWSSTTSVR